MLLKQGNYDAAIADFEKVFAMASDDIGLVTDAYAEMEADGSAYLQELKFNQIVAYEYLGDFSTAKSLMEEYLQAYPDDSDAKWEYEFLQTR